MRLLSIPRLAAASVLLAGCTGLIGGSDEGEEPAVNQDPAALCDAGLPNVGAAPLRRLTRVEYNHAVRDLLDIETDAGLDFAPDDKVAGYYGNSIASMSESQVEELVDVGGEVATLALGQHRDEWFTCDVSETSCVAPWIEKLATRAFRRPPEAEVLQGLVDQYEHARDTWGQDKALELVMTSILASPHFVYHFELTPAEPGQVVALGPYEVASRLSFFFWQSIPDDALLEAAADGSLSTPEGIEAQARRMIASERARNTVDSFHRQWLELSHLDQVVKDGDVYPDWSPELSAKMEHETMAFVHHIFEQGRPATELLTADYTFADASLARYYDVDPPTETDDDGFGRVSLPPERRGLLTQGSFLASRAHATDTSWVLRGLFVRQNLLCQAIPAPPPGVDQAAANDPDRLENPECKSCHLLMDPIGFGFEGYGAVGELRTETPDGEPIDAQGELMNGQDEVAFDSPVELAEVLAADEGFGDCMATQWFRYLSRRFETDEDQCAIEDVQSQFRDSGYDLRELLIAYAKSDVFRYRRGPETEGEK